MSKINKRSVKKVFASTKTEAATLASPHGKIAISIYVCGGVAAYGVSYEGKEIIMPSSLGLTTSVADFSRDIEFSNATNIVRRSDTYTLLSAKKKLCSNEYNERTITFNKSDKQINIVFRAYDYGIAFRYELTKGKPFSIRGENTTYVLPSAATAWHNDRFADNYEYNHLTDSLEAIARDKRFNRTQIPLLVRLENGIYAEICESNLSGNYSGAMLVPKLYNNAAILATSFVKKQKHSVKAPAAFRSPWRYIVIGDESVIIENTMATDLADNPDSCTDYSFAEAGATAWSWLDNERPSNIGGTAYQHDTEAIIKHIDLAAEMGWKYFIMDEGWQPKSKAKHENYDGYFPEFDIWRKHAEEKGIKLVAWCDCYDLKTAEKRKRLADWKAHGIWGIKVDFFDNENQETLKLYQDIYKACSLCEMIVIVHGANKSSGEERTYPHVLTREGIYGQEQGSVTAKNSVACAFTRYSVGNTDFTEYLIPRENNVKIGFQLAMSFIYVSGVHCFADGVSNYRKSEAAQILLKNFPSSFDEVKYIDGTPDSYICLARRAGDTWYLAGISDIDTEVTIALDFLDKNKDYIATIFTDSNDYLTLNKEERHITPADTITVKLNKNGGFAAKIQ